MHHHLVLDSQYIQLAYVTLAKSLRYDDEGFKPMRLPENYQESHGSPCSSCIKKKKNLHKNGKGFEELTDLLHVPYHTFNILLI